MTSQDEIRSQIASLVNKYAEIEYQKRDFIPGESVVPVSGKVLDVNELNLMVSASLDGWLTTGRFNEIFEKRLANFLGVKHLLTTNSGSSANLLAFSALTSPRLKERSIKHGALYRYGKFFIGKTFKKGKYTKCKLYFEVRPKQINIEYDLKKLKKNLLKLKIMKIKKTSNNFTYEEIDAKQFLSFGLKNLKKNPYFFLKKNTINELKKKKLFHFKKFKIKEFE